VFDAEPAGTVVTADEVGRDGVTGPEAGSDEDGALSPADATASRAADSAVGRVLGVEAATEAGLVISAADLTEDGASIVGFGGGAAAGAAAIDGAGALERGARTGGTAGVLAVGGAVWKGAACVDAAARLVGSSTVTLIEGATGSTEGVRST
jgi:hypothetical protein